MKLSYEIETAYDAANVTGECPLWHPTENRLYWIDTRLPSLQRLERDQSVRVWPLPDKIGSFVFREWGGLILGLERGFCAFDLETFRAHAVGEPGTRPVRRAAERRQV